MPGFHVKGLLAAVLVGAVAGLISAIVDGHVQVPWVIVAVLAVFVANLGHRHRPPAADHLHGHRPSG